eukprot:1144641-Pelagomonas_calceolata.AAC.9
MTLYWTDASTNRLALLTNSQNMHSLLHAPSFKHSKSTSVAFKCTSDALFKYTSATNALLQLSSALLRRMHFCFLLSSTPTSSRVCQAPKGFKLGDGNYLNCPILQRRRSVQPA